MDYFQSMHPALQSFFATLFTWGVTALGAALVFFVKKENKTIMDILLGFSGGVMIAASFWSLLSPAIELCAEMEISEWIMPASGFVIGGVFIIFADKMIDKFGFTSKFTGHNEPLKRSILLVTAVTLHNIPEGMAIGVAFAGTALNIPGASLVAAALLALGIGLQNFPEGAAVSLPLHRDGLGKGKSFFYGQASGFVEPIAAVVGALAAYTLRGTLPFFLAFSAGAMVGVVSAELIPEAVKDNKNLATIGIILGFTVMMVLDVALG